MWIHGELITLWKKMNDSILGIIITFLVIGIVLSVGVGLQGGVDIKLDYNPNGAQTKSIEQLKADNLAERSESLNSYCEAFNINCG